MGIIYTKKHDKIIASGIEAISKVLLGRDITEKESLLLCLDKYFDPYFKYDLATKDEIISLVQRVVIDKNSDECKDEALHLLSEYAYPPFKILEENIDKIDPKFLPDVKHILKPN